MEEVYDIVRADKPAWDVIGPAVNEYNQLRAGEDHARSICYLLRAPGGEIAGGVIGVVYWEWFSLELIWVREDLRGRGFGHRLLALAEEEARQRGAGRVHLDTFSFQAPVFYQKHGYTVFGQLADYPAGHQRYYLTKQL